MPEKPSLVMQPMRDRRPLSVQVYDRLIAALRASDVRPGDAIPPELELARDLGVSRTVLREALRLLEEDGVLQRGVDRRRRHLAETTSRSSGFQTPLEDMLQAPGRLAVEVVRFEELPATSWGARLLGVPVGTVLQCQESLLMMDGEPVASALELVDREDPAVAALSARGAPTSGGTLLQALGPQFRARLSPSVWRLAAATAKGTRRGFTRLPRGAVVGSLTAVLDRHGAPAYLAKNLIRLDAVVLAVGGSPTGPDGSDLDGADLDAVLDDDTLAGVDVL